MTSSSKDSNSQSKMAGLNNTIHLYSITAANEGPVVRHDKKYEPS